jgi:hypothetical protein
MSETKKPKRKLSNIDFSREDAHIAICHKDQSVANMQDFALVLKAQNFSDEFIEKMQTVRVTMELPEFLRRFFNMYGEDAEILARMMGYEPESREVATSESYEDYIQSRLQSYEILKAAAEADNLASVLADLSEDQYLSILQDQETIEKAFSKYDNKKKEDEEKAKTNKGKPKVKTTRSFDEPNSLVSKSESSDVAKAAEVETPIASGDKGVPDPVVKQKLKEKLMTQEVKIVEQVVETEMIEKAAFEQIQKQAAEQAEILKAALAELEVFKVEKAAMIAKSRKQALVDAVKAEDKAEVLFKAVGDLQDEAFEAVVAVVKQLTVQTENSDMFLEKGATTESLVADKESAVAKLIKKQQVKK